jgi:putative lipoprotein
VLEVREDGAVSGSGGCNRFAGRAEIGDGTIRFGPIAGTKMMCPPAAMDQEMKFFAALPQAASWRIDQQTRNLTLLDAEGRALVVFASMD